MSYEKYERNKDIVQLYKIGFHRPLIIKTFGIEKRNLKRLLIRDWDKYPLPDPREMWEMEVKYQIKIGPIKQVDKPTITPKQS